MRKTGSETARRQDDDGTVSLSARIVDSLRNEILRGSFPPGSLLPELRLSRDFDTSRTVVREALRTLSEIGLVTLHPRRRAVVTSLTPKGIRELFSLRAVLEAFALRLAMTEGRMGPPELAEIERRYETLRASVESGDDFRMIEADMSLHWALCAPCAHELLLDQLRALQTRTRTCIFSTKFYGSDVESEIEAHAPILSAVRDYDVDRAEAAMRNHILSAGERLLITIMEAAQRPASARPAARKWRRVAAQAQRPRSGA